MIKSEQTHLTKLRLEEKRLEAQAAERRRQKRAQRPATKKANNSSALFANGDDSV